MKPLQAVGLGFVLIAVQANFGAYDALPDPLGWLLILYGVRGLLRRTPIGFRLGLTYLGVLALIVAAVRWVPAGAEAIAGSEHALVWAADLPALAFQAVLCHALAQLARDAGDRRATGWLRCTSIGLVVAIALPVLYFGAGLDFLEGTGDIGLVLQLLVLVLAFVFSGRAWAGATDDLDPDPARRR